MHTNDQHEALLKEYKPRLGETEFARYSARNLAKGARDSTNPERKGCNDPKELYESYSRHSDGDNTYGTSVSREVPRSGRGTLAGANCCSLGS